MHRKRDAKTQKKGPHLTQNDIPARDFFVLLYTNWRMLVSTARLIPHVSECVNDLVAGVLIEANPLNRPARSNGQHQLPTRAGMEKTSVPIATHVDHLSCGAKCVSAS